MLLWRMAAKKQDMEIVEEIPELNNRWKVQLAVLENPANKTVTAPGFYRPPCEGFGRIHQVRVCRE